MQDLRDPLAALCDRAAAAILAVYEQGRPVVDRKADDSPLTEADLASHRVLMAGLPKILDVPVVSEEGGADRAAGRYWLVDPLDGTKEFIKRNGEFTVNVALVEDGHPVFGVVQVPVTGVCYAGGLESGAWIRDGAWRPLGVASLSEPLRAVVSKSHRGEAVDGFLKAMKKAGHTVEDVAFGSSLKICKVAEGSAHVYPRLGPTMPWDTAAAHAVLEGAGGIMMDARGEGLQYLDVQTKNPWFIAATPGLDWADFVPQRT